MIKCHGAGCPLIAFQLATPLLLNETGNGVNYETAEELPSRKAPLTEAET